MKMFCSISEEIVHVSNWKSTDVILFISIFFSLQVLTQKLEQTTKSKIYLIKRLDKSKEDIDDLKFQVGIFMRMDAFELLCFFVPLY